MTVINLSVIIKALTRPFVRSPLARLSISQSSAGRRHPYASKGLTDVYPFNLPLLVS